jgi:tetrapyrrole methylase family protein / MazG family protein
MATRKKNKPKARKASKVRKPGNLRGRALTSANRVAGAGDWFAKLVAVQARLRAADGCPWDREQTHETLRTYLIEEAYEVLEALESRNDRKFAEELGDLLLQIVFHSEIARQERRFDVTDVIREIHDKMVRRHPHVFGKRKAKDSAEVLKNWEQIKAEERRAAKGSGTAAAAAGDLDDGDSAPSLLDGISRGLPATLEGFQLTRRAARIGFDWDSAEGVLEKIAEEGAELREALARGESRHIEEEIGDLLFAAVNLARFLHVDPEIALKKANAKFSGRFRAMEGVARESGRALADLPRAEMEAFWETVKEEGEARGEEGAGGADSNRRARDAGDRGGIKPPLERAGGR